MNRRRNKTYLKGFYIKNNNFIPEWNGSKQTYTCPRKRVLSFAAYSKKYNFKLFKAVRYSFGEGGGGIYIYQGQSSWGYYY